ncbi:MAG: cellulase family glycosylhydrolase [Anaerolineae bacterium]|nr:cellulase family glycosylhydrolase [Anaerolineae bacterium]
MDKTPALFPRKLFGFRLFTLVVIAAALLVGLAALGVDLVSKGRVYDYLWDVTGETDPGQQLLGFGQYLARYTRRQPDTQPYARIENTDVNPYGVNTFLEQEVEPQKREQQVQMIVEAGFHWIRQQFPWEDIEIDGKGDFIDRRHDRDGDGVKDEISAWDKYDHIVDLADTYELEIIVRLSAPPAWSQPPGTTNRMTPPADFQDFADYAAAVAARYRDRIRHYQVWNEPNLYPEWGDQTVNAEAYTDLLCRTYDALKAVDPAIVVITGALGPTVDLSGTNAYDLLYLQRMYQAGAGDCFDVLSVQGYGLWSGPTDDRLRQVTINYQRHLWIRDMMVANGDAHKPIWISEAAWNPVPDDPAIADLDRYGRVTMDQAAGWAPLAYERAIKEWPWIGVVNYWYFKRATDDERGQSWYYFRLVEPDFTPTPVYEALKAYITGEQPKTLGAGRHGTQTRGLIGQDADGHEVRTFRIDGTDAYLCHAALPAALPVTVRTGDQPPREHTIPAGETGCIQLDGEFESGEHLIDISAADWSGLHSLVVVDQTARQRLPWLLTGIIAALFALVVLIHAVDVRLNTPRR